MEYITNLTIPTISSTDVRTWRISMGALRRPPCGHRHGALARHTRRITPANRTLACVSRKRGPDSTWQGGDKSRAPEQHASKSTQQLFAPANAHMLPQIRFKKRAPMLLPGQYPSVYTWLAKTSSHPCTCGEMRAPLSFMCSYAPHT